MASEADGRQARRSTAGEESQIPAWEEGESESVSSSDSFESTLDTDGWDVAQDRVWGDSPEGGSASNTSSIAAGDWPGAQVRPARAQAQNAGGRSVARRRGG